MEEKRAVATAKFFFGAKRHGVPQNPAAWRQPRARPLISFKQKKVAQVQMMLGFPALPYGDRRAPALHLLDIILGGGMSSRLFMEVREKRGLAYLIRTDASHYRDTGTFLVHAGLDAGRLPEALRVIMAELQKMKNTLVSEQELHDAKEHWYGKLVLAWEDSAAHADWYAKQTFYKKIETPDEVWQRLQKVTAEEVRALATSIINWKTMKVAIIGGSIEAAKLERQLRLDS